MPRACLEMESVLQKRYSGDNTYYGSRSASFSFSNPTNNSNYFNKVFTLACVIIMSVILTLLIVIAFTADFRAQGYYTYSGASYENTCKVQLVESIPKVLNYKSGTIVLNSTYSAWKELLSETHNASIQIASSYWTMLASDVGPPTNKIDAKEGEHIFGLLKEIAGNPSSKLNIVSDSGSENAADLVQLSNDGADVKYLNMTALVGAGILHTKFISRNLESFYVGSANMDYRSLTMVKEIGLHFTHCPTLAKDIGKIWTEYDLVADPSAEIPENWPSALSTPYNKTSPLQYKLNNITASIYFAVSPPQFQSDGRTEDIKAILDIMDKAERFVHISVMDFTPGFVYLPQFYYWPIINDKLKLIATNRGVHVRLLISKWIYTDPTQITFLDSLNVIKNITGIEIRLFEFHPPTGIYVDHTHVNHAKYMVTENVAYIGTNNWTADYFINTGGIGTVINQTEAIQNDPKILNSTIQEQLRQVFERDWNSIYSRPLNI